jgi:hypothetical protein
MADREFPFDDNFECDVCGTLGAFDIYGDYYCENCAKGLVDGEDLDDPLFVEIT